MISKKSISSLSSSPYPGKIIPLDLKDYDEKLICQKDAFLCAAKGVALFGGEGFIMQKLEGDGLTFVHAGSLLRERPSGWIPVAWWH